MANCYVWRFSPPVCQWQPSFVRLAVQCWRALEATNNDDDWWWWQRWWFTEFCAQMMMVVMMMMMVYRVTWANDVMMMMMVYRVLCSNDDGGDDDDGGLQRSVLKWWWWWWWQIRIVKPSLVWLVTEASWQNGTNGGFLRSVVGNSCGTLLIAVHQPSGESMSQSHITVRRWQGHCKAVSSSANSILSASTQLNSTQRHPKVD